MALAAGSFTHMPVLPTLNYASKKSMTITIKCANNNKNKTKIDGKKPRGSTGSGVLGTDPKSKNSYDDDDDEHDKNKIKVDPKKPTGSTGSGGLGTDPQTENPRLPKNPTKNYDDDEDQLDNTFAFNLTSGE